MRKIQFYIIPIILLSLYSCGNGNSSGEETTSDTNIVDTKKEKQLNITILLDLSDRIEPTKYPASPEHFERDIEIVNYFTELFKQDMESKGAFNTKGKLKVIFSPRPQDSEVNTVASKLSIDLSKIRSPKEKKQIFNNISSSFKGNLSKIYTKTLETKKYLGSDTWRFFKNDVVDYCIEQDENYRNILVLITDGYLYHFDTRDKQKNRTSYLLPKLIKSNNLRNSNWEEKITKDDYGYITTRNDLNNLDILVLEINPSPQHKNDEDVIKAYLTKWFTEMNVNSFKLYNSDLPEYTKTRIEKFIIK
ncbi:MAG: hypothetical protein L3J35_05510 [Bacteroidales bacterium]|nr:hypothetical protein [Bacteroidales bacterium]